MDCEKSYHRLSDMEKHTDQNLSKITIKEALTHIGTKRLAALVLSIVVAVSIILAISIPLYQSTKRSIELVGEYGTSQTADRLDRYLMTGRNAIVLSGSVLSNMIRLNASAEELLSVMMEESERLVKNLDDNFKGIFGWLNGTYLTTTGFVPDSTYVPTERPWYQMAKKSHGEIVYVDPYVDAKTGNRIMTIAKLLGDGDSVIALDVPLDKMQKIVDEAALELKGGASLVLGKNGEVVVSSDLSQIGQEYLKEENTLGSLIAEQIYQEHQNSFEVNFEGQSYVVYDTGIDSGWHVVSILNSRYFYGTLRIVVLISCLLLLLIIVILTVVFVRISKRSLLAGNLNLQLSAIADIYNSVIDINIPEDTFIEIVNREDFAGVAVNSKTRAQESLYAAVEQLAAPAFHTELRDMLNLSDLGERLKGRSNLVLEFLDHTRGWCRGRLIAAQRDISGKAIRVLWAIESIDEEKRRRDELIRLAEMDQMTGILNRASGEQKIQEQLILGNGGMFMMLDIDHFKSINDHFGHDVGDLVIKQVAGSLRNAFRNGDIVMRLGGDEFAAFAPGVYSRDISDRIMERFFQYMTNSEVPEMKGNPVSVSAGVAFCSEEDGRFEFLEVYKKADQRVYQSKKTEGNQITYE